MRDSRPSWQKRVQDQGEVYVAFAHDGDLDPEVMKRLVRCIGEAVGQVTGRADCCNVTVRTFLPTKQTA